MAWGETTSYVLEHANQIEIYSTTTLADHSSDALSLDGPGATLSFDAQGTGGATGNSTGNFYAQTSTNGSSWTDVGSALSIKHKQFTHFDLSIPSSAKYVRFIAKKGSKYYKQIKNIKVTRATTLSVNSSSPALSFGNIHRGNNKTIKAKVDWNNTTYDQQLTGKDLPTGYSVTATTMGEYGTGKEIPVKFKFL